MGERIRELLLCELGEPGRKDRAHLLESMLRRAAWGTGVWVAAMVTIRTLGLVPRWPATEREAFVAIGLIVGIVCGLHAGLVGSLRPHPDPVVRRYGDRLSTAATMLAVYSVVLLWTPQMSLGAEALMLAGLFAFTVASFLPLRAWLNQTVRARSRVPWHEFAWYLAGCLAVTSGLIAWLLLSEVGSAIVAAFVRRSPALAGLGLVWIASGPVVFAWRLYMMPDSAFDERAPTPRSSPERRALLLRGLGILGGLIGMVCLHKYVTVGVQGLSEWLGLLTPLAGFVLIFLVAFAAPREVVPRSGSGVGDVPLSRQELRASVAVWVWIAGIVLFAGLAGA